MAISQKWKGLLACPHCVRDDWQLSRKWIRAGLRTEGRSLPQVISREYLWKASMMCFSEWEDVIEQEKTGFVQESVAIDLLVHK